MTLFSSYFLIGMLITTALRARANNQIAIMNEKPSFLVEIAANMLIVLCWPVILATLGNQRK